MINTKSDIFDFSKFNSFNEKVAELLINSLKRNLSQKQQTYLALSGGNTPKPIFELLANEHSKTIDWSKVMIFWVDERTVPQSSSESNFGNAKRILLNSLDGVKFFRMRGEIDAKDAAKEYEQILLKHLPLKKGVPVFDVMLLGMGDDGHTASLFPNSDVLREKTKFVKAVWVEKNNSYRLTLTIPVINKSKSRIFAFHGKTKYKLFKNILESSTIDYPIQMLEYKNQKNYFIIGKDLK